MGVSRAKRFNEAMEQIEDAKSTIGELKDELNAWVDNMPENLKRGEVAKNNIYKASQFENTIEALETMLDGLNDATSADIKFPGIWHVLNIWEIAFSEADE